MKNKITNFLGLVFFGLAIYNVIYTDWEAWELVVLVIIGLALWLFSNTKLKSLLTGIITKNSNTISSKTIGGEIPDDDDE